MAALKMAFLGCGEIARFHLAGIREGASRIELTAAIDLDPEKAHAYAAQTRAVAYTSLDEALSHSDFDAVDIMLPHDLHEQAAIRCFEAGKHVLLEKPMAPNLEACARIMQAAGAAGTVFMVAENAQYWPEVVKAQEIIESGAIGEPITARAAFVAEYRRTPDDASPWRFDAERAGGGITIDGGSHWIRPLRMWFGEIDAVVAALDRPLADMQGESLTRALIRFRSGKFAVFDAMSIETVLAPDDLWRITCTQGEITIASRDGAIRLYDQAHRSGQRLMEPAGYAKSFGPELADFADAVLDGKTLKAGPEASLGELRTALAMYRSAERGAWQPVWD